MSLAGLKETLQGVLDTHARYLKDRESVARELAGKQVRHPSPWKMAAAIPSLRAQGRLAAPYMPRPDGRLGSCIHCHIVPTHELLSLRAAKRPIPDRKIWPYPMPDSIGLQMATDQCATVQDVRADSTAAAAGIEKGDSILRFDGQAILSTADMQWVLHNAGDAEKLLLDVDRAGEVHQLELELPDGWRRQIEDWRFINLGVLSQVVGFNGRPLDGDRLSERGLELSDLAFEVGKSNPRLLGDIDLRRGDLIVEIDGRRKAMNLGQFTRYVLVKKESGSTLDLVRVRNGQGRRIQVPVR